MVLIVLFLSVPSDDVDRSVSQCSLMVLIVLFLSVL